MSNHTKAQETTGTSTGNKRNYNDTAYDSKKSQEVMQDTTNYSNATHRFKNPCETFEFVSVAAKTPRTLNKTHIDHFAGKPAKSPKNHTKA